MKKIVSLLLVALLTVSLLASCAREIPQTDPTDPTSPTGELVPEEGAELLYWAEKEGFEPIAEAFEKEYGVKVNVEVAGFDSANKLMLEGPAGNGADVIYASTGSLGTLSNAGVIKHIDKTIASRLEETILETAYKSSSIGDELYAVPMIVESLALFYNKDLVDEIPQTFEEILANSEGYTDSASNIFYYIMTLGAYNFQFASSAYGQYYFGEDGMDADDHGLDSPEMIETLKFVAEVGKAIDVPAADLQMAGSDFIIQNFLEGKTPFMLNGPWATPAIKDSDINFGVTSLPTVGGNASKPFLGCKVNVVSEYSEYPIAAQLFAEYLTSETAASIIYNDMGEVTSRVDISNVDGLSDDEISKGFASQFGNTVIQPNISRMSYIWTIVDSNIISVFDGTLSPEECATKMAKEFDALVASE